MNNTLEKARKSFNKLSPSMKEVLKERLEEKQTRVFNTLFEYDIEIEKTKDFIKGH